MTHQPYKGTVIRKLALHTDHSVYSYGCGYAYAYAYAYGYGYGYGYGYAYAYAYGYGRLRSHFTHVCISPTISPIHLAHISLIWKVRRQWNVSRPITQALTLTLTLTPAAARRLPIAAMHMPAY